MSFRRVTAFLLIFAASVLPSLAQTRNNTRSTFTIVGTVRDDTDQHPMENIQVDLKTSTGIPVNTTYTRGNGEFEFGNLGTGEYFVEVNVKDYEPNRQTVTILHSERQNVSIFLTRPITVTKSNSQGSISAHELSVPGKAHDEYEKGLQLLYSKSDFRGAIVQFDRAIKDFPTFYEAYAQIGTAYLQLRDMAPAEEAMRKSVALSSGQYSQGIFMLAGLLNDTNRCAEGETTARKGMDVDPASWHGPYELARSFLGLKQLEDAEKGAIEARDMKPDNPPVYLMLANIHIQRHDYAALSKDLQAYLKLVPSGPEADQARKTLDEIQAAMQQAENRARANVQEKPHADAQDASRANSKPPETQKELPLPPEPDSSGLPSLPPPDQDNQ